MFSEAPRIARADGILFNPPVGQTSEHSAKEWGSGRISAAALYLDDLVTLRTPGTPIAAILPEVLRCGTRYERFRARIQKAGLSGTFISHGTFDRWTDVDVFTTLLESRNGTLRSEEHTSELQSLMRISYAVFCLKKKKSKIQTSQKH